MKPRIRKDCQLVPRSCPWCLKWVTMRLRGQKLPQKGEPPEDELEEMQIDCPECGGRVRYVRRGESWSWSKHRDDAQAPEHSAEYARALNSCRPCPWISCRFNLYLDVNPTTGSLKINFPGQDPDEVFHSCALDVAEQGGNTLKEVGDILQLTRERIRQLEVKGLLILEVEGPNPDD